MRALKVGLLISFLVSSGGFSQPGGPDDLTIWKDRAKEAGWKLEIEYQDPECLRVVFRFSRAT
jgi:hypothetical protein